MGIKVALALLFIQVALSSCRSTHHREEASQEVSLDEGSRDPRLAKLLSMLEDSSIDSDEQGRKLVRILPVSTEEEDPRGEKTHVVELATLRRKSKKPLAIILSTSDLKHKKYSRRKLNASAPKDVSEEVAAKEEIKDLTEESSSKDYLNEELAKEDLISEEVKGDLSKELSAEDLTKEELTKELINEYLTKEISSEVLIKDDLSELSKEDLSLEKYEKHHKSQITLSQEEVIKELSDENVVLDKSESVVSATDEDSVDNILVSEAQDLSEEDNDLTVEKKSDSYADIIELTKLLAENHNEKKSSRSGRRQLEQNNDNRSVIQRYVDENHSESVVADIWQEEKGKGNQLHRTYNLSFLFNKK